MHGAPPPPSPVRIGTTWPKVCGQASPPSCPLTRCWAALSDAEPAVRSSSDAGDQVWILLDWVEVRTLEPLCL